MSDEERHTPHTKPDPEEGIIKDISELDFTRHDEIESLGDNRYVFRSQEERESEDMVLESTKQPNTNHEGEAHTLYSIRGEIMSPEDERVVNVHGDDVVHVFEEFMNQYAACVAPEDDEKDIIELLVTALLADTGEDL